MEAKHWSPRRLAEITDIPEDTIKGWLKGRVKRIREWQRVLLLAATLGLDHAETEHLFQVAQAPLICLTSTTVQQWLTEIANPSFRDLVMAWWVSSTQSAEATGPATEEQPPACVAAPAQPHQTAEPCAEPLLFARSDLYRTDTWTTACEEAMRAGAVEQLAELLVQAPALTRDAPLLFYQAHLAAARASYQEAAELFHAARLEAEISSDTYLAHASLVWQAYCQTLLGNYPFATTLLVEVSECAPSDDVWVHIWFVKGLIAANVATLLQAEHAFVNAKLIAMRLNDHWLEGRCCANLAAIYEHMGLLDRVARLIRRVEQIQQEGPYHQRWSLQIRNITVNRLRLQGDLGAALQVALPLPTEGGVLFRGWLALSTAHVAMDADDFALAEYLCSQASELLEPVYDQEFSSAELRWQYAWLRFRQGRLDEAYRQSQAALTLLDDHTDADHLHAFAIAGIIALARYDFGAAWLHLHRASEGFRAIYHTVGLASVLFHLAEYYLQIGQLDDAGPALAEALILVQKHHLYNTYYWAPNIMVRLCGSAMQGTLWSKQPLDFETFASQSARSATNTRCTRQPEDVVGDAATSLVIRRLASSYWQEFMSLLSDPCAKVRWRVAQVLYAAKSHESLHALQQLRNDPDRRIQHWLANIQR
jgi:tetratricopeptide (TPR) repeat protein